MSQQLQARDHPVLHKVATILPYLVGAEKLHRQTFVRLATVYNVGGDVAVALAGVGVGTPVAALLLGKSKSGDDALTVINTIFPSYLTPVGVLALVAWITVRVFVQNQDAVTRARRVWDLQPVFTKAYDNIDRALDDPTPMPTLIAIQKRVLDKVDESIDAGIWPYKPAKPNSPDVLMEIERRIAKFKMDYQHIWLPPPDQEQE